MLDLIRRIWRDPVWSKVIAAGIIAAFVFAFGHRQVSALAVALWGLLSLSVPLWLAVCVCAATTTGGVLLVRRRLKSAATLQVIRKTESNYWWHLGGYADRPAMQIVGSATATNTSNVPILIPRVELRYGSAGWKQISGMVLVAKEWMENFYGIYEIPPGESRDVTFNFWLLTPVRNPVEDFKAHSIVLIDQFGSTHALKRVVFHARAKDVRPQPIQPEESVYQILDPIEKEIVSVLKAELGRYQMCGRTGGGLGSVHVVYQGRVLTGMGTDSWRPDSPQNQIIVNDPTAATLRSDNLEVLMKFYSGLQSNDEQGRFIEFLVDRLDENKGYLAVSYFIVLALWQAGALPKALKAARQKLPEKEHSVFGLSNVLMLLNGLLRFRYPDLTAADLDQIEAFTDGMQEHTFQIPAKLAAVRTSRLGATK